MASIQSCPDCEVEPGQRMWNNNAGSEKEMTEELYYAAIWVMYNGNKNPAPSGGDQLAGL